MAYYSFIHGDALETVSSFEQKFNLIITSPPYNINKEYEVKKSLDDYLGDQKKVIKGLVSCLHDSGSICWQVGNYVDKMSKEAFPLDIYFYDIFKELGLKLKNRIIWKFGHGLHAKTKFSGRYETILWFVKGDNYTFNLDNVRIAQKYPGKKSYKKHNHGEFTGNPLGKNPSDIWDKIESDWDNGIWDIPNVKANHIEKTIHPCQFPIAVAERCILALSNENDWVLDPYVGVGSSVIASIMNNRNCIGIDKHKKYLQIGQQRVDAFHEGNLKYRPIGKDVFVPDSSKLAVAKTPIHFKKARNGEHG